MPPETISGDQLNQNKKIQRFATLDFARGLSIFLMVILHVITDCLNSKELIDNMSDIPLLNALLFVILPFLGGLAGFFLLVSSTSNMVSMMKHLKGGKSVRSLVIKQLFAGVVLLIFGMVCESLTGYHGTFGKFFLNLDNPFPLRWDLVLYRWNYFETIHTIAWCIIINGIIQGLLSLKNNWKNTKKLIISYIVLAVSIVGLTQLVWYLVGLAIPGYPSGTYPSGHSLNLPWIGTESFWEIFRAPFLNALASPIEPLFPYLAVSFIGSIIGIVISQPKEEINKKFSRNTLLSGLGMFVTGLIGVVIVIAKVISTSGFDQALSLYMKIFEHRDWSPDITPGIPLFSWLWQFLLLTGFSLMALIFLFRLVEFRGKGKIFADKTKFFRRFGIVAFSNYNNQFIYLIAYFLISSLLSLSFTYQQQNWFGVFLIAVLAILLYHILLRGWEKIRYFGSFEWIFLMINNNIIPTRRARFDKSVKWWQRGLIDVENSFYNAEWINLDISQNKSIAEYANKDSKLAFILSIVGLCSFVFIPVCFISLPLSLKAQKIEGRNRQNIHAFRLSLASMVLFVGIIIVSLILKVGLILPSTI